jgi:hypothetical protein
LNDNCLQARVLAGSACQGGIASWQEDEMVEVGTLEALCFFVDLADPRTAAESFPAEVAFRLTPSHEHDDLVGSLRCHLSFHIRVGCHPATAAAAVACTPIPGILNPAG